ncbi:hypothetical protein DPV78_012543 [Talaromyces pinophilus]|nr:hypothetical protein DPV78_012543 [Talaromyces pinophilus]
MTSQRGIRHMTPPAIPQRFSSLIPQDIQREIAEYDKQVEKQKSSLSLLSVESSVSDFLEEKFKECEYDLAASLAKLSALQQAVRQGTLSQEDYLQAAEPFFEYQKERFNEKKYLSKHRRFLEANISEEVDLKKPRLDGPEVDFYERAYMNTIIPRVMGASAKQTKSNFNGKRFRNAVLEAYNASDPGNGDPVAWCHISHDWYATKLVKAAHLVPKSLTDPEIAHLFGVEEVPKDFFYDWRLGISLHQNIEQALDQGTIVIVPKPVGNETRWECVLLDMSKAKRTAISLPRGDQITWGDLHHKELEFRGENRPARRYLYFRFILTVLHAIRTGNKEFVSQLQQKERFWASPGKYLQRGTLVSLARNISGLDLPESIYQDTTFPETVGSQDPEETAMVLTLQLKDAILESARKAEEREQPDYESESEEESEDEMDVDEMNAV